MRGDLRRSRHPCGSCGVRRDHPHLPRPRCASGAPSRRGSWRSRTQPSVLDERGAAAAASQAAAAESVAALNASLARLRILTRRARRRAGLSFGWCASCGRCGDAGRSRRSRNELDPAARRRRPGRPGAGGPSADRDHRARRGRRRDPALAPAAIARVAERLAEYRQEIDDLGAERQLAYATSAVRDAGNSAEFLAGVTSEFGLPTRLLSGDEEARLTFLGVDDRPRSSTASRSSSISAAGLFSREQTCLVRRDDPPDPC